MAVSYYWQDQFGVQPPAITNPLNNHGFVTVGALNNDDTFVRAILDIEMKVTVDLTSLHPVPPFDWWTSVAVCVGVWWDPDGATPPPSSIPHPDQATKGWVLTEWLTPSIEPITDSKGSYVITLKSPGMPSQTHGERKSSPGSAGVLWLTWFVNENVALINNPVSGYFIKLGYTNYLRALFRNH